MTGSIKMFDW